jgi:hypothetical protein
MVELVGYGQISDISYPETEQAPDYPYVFINPVSTDVNSRVFSVTVNLIAMTQVAEDASSGIDEQDKESIILQGQSECMQILNDILAYFELSDGDLDMSYNKPVSMTPFVERFQDDVVGATATLTINYASPMNICATPIGDVPKSLSQGIPATVIDGDNTKHLVYGGQTYSCLPATPKSGIFYQRQLPWAQNDPSIDGSIAWHIAQGTYNYTPPSNPLYIAALPNDYDYNTPRLLQPNAFGNYYRFTNDIGEEYVENFFSSAANNSSNPRYCIDHLSGLGWYVERHTVDRIDRTFPEAIQAAADFSYGGFDDWRLADVAEYLNAVDYNDWSNSYGGVNAPFVDPTIRNYGGMIRFGTYTKDNQQVWLKTNGSTITLNTSLDYAYSTHLFLIRNHYI